MTVRKWPRPGTREGQLYGSSIEATAIASPAKRSSDYGGATEPPIPSLRSAMRKVANHPNPRTRYLPQSRSLDVAQQAFVGLPGAASGDKAPGRIDDGSPVARSRACRFERVIHTCELLGAQELDIRSTVSIDIEDGERTVQHVRRFAVHHFHDDADLVCALSGEVGTPATTSRRSIRMKAVLASACSVSSAESRNNFDGRPITFAFCAYGPVLSLWPPGLKWP